MECGPVCLAKSGIVGKSKNRRRTADGFQIFSFISPIFIKLNKTTGFQGNRQKITKICGDPLGDGPRCLLVSCWLKTRWEMCPSGLHFNLGISQSVSATLKASMRRSPILFGHFPKSRQYPCYCLNVFQASPRAFRRIFQRFTALNWAFPSHFPRSSMFLLSRIKNRRYNRKI
jgi:hypothetical protein